MTEPDPLTTAEMHLRDRALTYPDATEDFPWDHRAIKVKAKLFVIFARSDAHAAPAEQSAAGYAGGDNGTLRVTVKLPDSNSYALMQAYAAPTGYGLGKSGWVTCTFRPDDAIPIDLLEEWIEESYRAIAPKKLVLALNARQAGVPEPPPVAAKPKRGPKPKGKAKRK